MFDSIVFKNGIGPGPLMDIGALAEALLFYRRVAIVANTATVKDLLRKIPPFVLLSLIKDERIEIHYLGDQVGVSTTEIRNGRELHNLMQFSSSDHTIEKIGPSVFRTAAGETGQARIGASQFTRLIKPIDHADFDQSSVLQALTDRQTTNASVESLIRTITSEFTFSPDFRFNIEQEEQGFYIDTNLNFVELNELYHKVVSPKHSSITPAYILALLQGAYETTYFAGRLNSEVAVHPIEGVVQAQAVEAIVRRHQQSTSQIKAFTDLTLAQGNTIREAVNSGSVPFSSIVKILDSADKFRHWLQQQPADVDLVRAYYQETIKDSWAEKLPAKSIRWGIFTGLGLTIDSLGAGGIGTVVGIAISLVDSFLMDKLIKGWKPHQFVEHELPKLFDSSKTRRGDDKK